MMEKNGAIGSDTPQPCCGGGCQEKKAKAVQLDLPFVDTEEEADALDHDLDKQAVDAVADASKSNK